MISAIKIDGRKVAEYDKTKGLTDLEPLKPYIGKEILIYGRNGKEYSHTAIITNIVDGEEGAILELGPRPEEEKPARFLYKGVGRNDLCPCGSGKKYKKCCNA